MKSAAQILKSKSDQAIYSVTLSTSVFDAVKLMTEKNIGALLVMKNAEIVGIVTERECARKIGLMDLSSRNTPVSDIMMSTVLYVSPRQTSEQCMALMTDKRVRHLPVMDDGKLLGIISIGDLVKDVISDQEFTIQQLQRYITGDRG